MLVPIQVSEVMQTPVETISPDAPVREAATRLIAAGIGSLVVCADGEPVGICTEVDVTRLVADGGDRTASTVADVTSSPLVTTSPDTLLQDAAETLRLNDVKRLPVLDEGELVGIVTNTDLANYLPLLLRRGRRDQADPERERHHVRADTAYENDDWTTEYLGSEDSIEVGDTVRFSKPLDEGDVEAFAEISGDTNRLHLDRDYAAGTRFGERIVHGTLVAGTISAALARLPGLTIYLSQDLSYLAPVPIGARATAACEVVEDMGRDRYRLSTQVTADDETVLEGEATVVVDPLPETA
jgi:CBS domain-containing protein/acyl dehydratase